MPRWFILHSDPLVDIRPQYYTLARVLCRNYTISLHTSIYRELFSIDTFQRQLSNHISSSEVLHSALYSILWTG